MAKAVEQRGDPSFVVGQFTSRPKGTFRTLATDEPGTRRAAAAASRTCVCSVLATGRLLRGQRRAKMRRACSRRWHRWRRRASGSAAGVRPALSQRRSSANGRSQPIDGEGKLEFLHERRASPRDAFFACPRRRKPRQRTTSREGEAACTARKMRRCVCGSVSGRWCVRASCVRVLVCECEERCVSVRASGCV